VVKGRAMLPHEYLVLFAVAALAGAVNSVAGGGTLLTFPSLLWAGQTEIVANATSTVALWPGQLSSLWGYRGQVASSPGQIGLLAIPSFLGGLLGAWVLVRTSNETFATVVPYLILLATLLFMAQEPLTRWQRRRALGRKALLGQPAAAPEALPEGEGVPLYRWLAVMVFQLGLSIYGGYFGAGIGILMLAAFGYLGLTNIHHMNGLKNLCGLAINAVAAVLFIAYRLVDWRLALLMAAGAVIGGYAGAGAAQRVGQKNVRRLVILIGFALTLWLLARRYWLAGQSL
jgi:uncharacterized membrane protein YfcA